ncbi:MAG: mechanosensitive ion channel family protein [bacterium]
MSKQKFTFYSKLGVLLITAWLVSVMMLAPVIAAENAEPNTQPELQADQVTPANLASPRATMRTFLKAMNDIHRGDKSKIADAVTTLNLSEINALVREEQGETLAWILLEIMDKTRKVNLDRVPDSKEGEVWVFHRYDKGIVKLARETDGRWLFDTETVAALEAIADELVSQQKVVGGSRNSEYLPWHLQFRQQLPEGLKARAFLLEHWQWLGLLIVVAVGVLADKLVSLFLRGMVKRWKRKREPGDSALDVTDNLLRPLGLMAMAMIWWIGIRNLGLPESALVVLLVAVKFLASAAAVWSAYRLVDLLSARLLQHARDSENKIDDVLAPLVPRSLKIFVTVVGIVFIADNLNVDVSGLIAGLGLGGLAFALAAKDMVQNLFGSFTVLMDRTFTVGDWIKVGDTEGTVEEIGFRSTRLRTFYNSQLTIPNSTFITANVDNMGQRTYRRLSTKFGITYQTPPDTVEAYCEGIREIIRQHPYMRKDYFHVYLNGLGSSSLDILVYVFWETPEWSTELRERHRFLLDCIRLAEQMGVEFAYPTQTLHMINEIPTELNSESSLDRSRELARNIVDESTGLGTRPDPVKF